jgi:hypothetical protein
MHLSRGLFRPANVPFSRKMLYRGCCFGSSRSDPNAQTSCWRTGAGVAAPVPASL